MLPDGWPIGSYDTYGEAQRAVDHLADREFPVQGSTIVGVEPMVVARVAAHRYDLLCQPRTAESGRDLLAALALKGR